MVSVTFKYDFQCDPDQRVVVDYYYGSHSVLSLY
ncbi:hypothetical protein J2Y88_002634 [Pseudomonas chlororaphis]|nr:hypothetical protein [Pseudomonas chlororaphis]MCP1593325.1 hypothetical protein [Pseudomonas chlororaphis]